MLVMGVGSSGARAVDAMHRLNQQIETVAVDTDAKVLEAMEPEYAMQVGASVTRGLSAGGDVELGRQSIEKDSSGIRQRLRNVNVLVIVVGLGGGMGSGAVPVITRIAREAGILVLAVVGIPFAFEGKKIARVADEALKRIRTHADAIVRIPNERLFERSDAELPVEQVFARSHQVMLDGIFSLWRQLAVTGVCGLDFASIHTMLRNCDGFCHMAVCDGSGEKRAVDVCAALLKHPLLGKGKLIGSAAGVIVGLTGGHDLKFSEIETVMNELRQQLPDEEVWVNFGIVIEPGFEGRLSVLVLLAEQWKEPLVDSAGRQMGFRFQPQQSQEQGELVLETVGKGEFTTSDPTIYNNQDLDVPAYIRREIKLPR
jgi:cell division protein FtsZ